MNLAPKLVPFKPQANKPKRENKYPKNQGLNRKIVFGEQGGICAWCHNSWCEHLHHIDHNTSNNKRENLVGLCRVCHMDYHNTLRPKPMN